MRRFFDKKLVLSRWRLVRKLDAGVEKLDSSIQTLFSQHLTSVYFT